MTPPLQATTTYRSVLGHIIKRIRSEKDISQGDLAFRLGMSQANISKLERGAGSMSVEQLLRLNRTLGLEPAEGLLHQAAEACEHIEKRGIKVIWPGEESTTLSMISSNALATLLERTE